MPISTKYGCGLRIAHKTTAVKSSLNLDPSRIIELNLIEDLETPAVKLVESSDLSERYSYLSFIWGTRYIPKTTP